MRVADTPADAGLAAAGITAAAWMNAARHYGPNYLLDAILSTLYEEGSLSGMAAGWRRESGKLLLDGSVNAAYAQGNGLLAETVVATAPHWNSIGGPMRRAFAAGLAGPVEFHGFTRPPFEFSLSPSRDLAAKDLSAICL